MLKTKKNIALMALASWLAAENVAAEEKAVKEEPAAEEKKEATEEEKKPQRNHVSAYFDYTTQNLLDDPYQYGFRFKIDSEVSVPVTSGIGFYNEFNFSVTDLSLYDYDFISRTQTELKDSLEGRAFPYRSDDFVVFFGAGATARRYEDMIDYKEEGGYVRQVGIGPRACLGLLSNPFDISLCGYYLMGEKQSSYDVARGNIVMNGELRMIPRIKVTEEFNIELDTSAAIHCHSLKGDTGVAGTENDLVFKLQPVFDLDFFGNPFDHFGVLGNLGITHRFSGDRITGFYGGGGLRVKW